MENNPIEKWLPIPINIYFNRYKISSLGNIVSVVNGNEKPISINDNGTGYKFVHLFSNGKCKYFTIHRLVALAFIPNPENKPQVHHINHIKEDNNVTNLAWCTQSENIRYSITDNNHNFRSEAKLAQLARLAAQRKGITLNEFRKRQKVTDNSPIKS